MPEEVEIKSTFITHRTNYRVIQEHNHNSESLLLKDPQGWVRKSKMLSKTPQNLW